MLTPTNFSASSDAPETPPVSQSTANSSPFGWLNNEQAAGGDSFQKAPFPYFGGKSIIAADIWQAFGQVTNYVEPFAGSLAVLLNRPAPKNGPETVNDLDCHLVNVWRAIQSAPEDLARLLVAPSCEVNTEAQHAALIRASGTVRESLGDPDWHCLKYAAWWIKGANEWIGDAWCTGEGPWTWTVDGGWQKNAGKGINRQLPHLGTAGSGINRQLPQDGDGGAVGQYQQRVDWITGWLRALRDRLCKVRIACGDWKRVLGDSVTQKHGITAILLDPPYDGTEYTYGKDCVPVSQDVREWCRANGEHPLLRIILCGRGNEHNELLAHGWTVKEWSANAGYSKTEGRHSEKLWLSPNCITTSPAQGDLNF